MARPLHRYRGPHARPVRAPDWTCPGCGREGKGNAAEASHHRACRAFQVRRLGQLKRELGRTVALLQAGRVPDSRHLTLDELVAVGGAARGGPPAELTERGRANLEHRRGIQQRTLEAQQALMGAWPEGSRRPRGL